MNFTSRRLSVVTDVVSRHARRGVIGIAVLAIGMLFTLTGCTGHDAPAASWQRAGTRIVTDWAEQVAQQVADGQTVWNEYPRMQLRRDEWQCLNGLWDYAVTDQAIRADWDGRTPAQGQILVPFCIESALSGVGRTVQENEVIWYRRSFTVPRTWRGRRVLMHFGAVDWQATVYVNGIKAGEHTGGYTPFTIDVTPYLQRGKRQQTVEVRVWDPTDAGYQPRGKQVNRPRSIWYTAVSGIWQTVWMEPVQRQNYIDNLTIEPDIDHKVLNVTVHTARSWDKSYEVRITLRDKQHTVACVNGSNEQRIAIPVEDMHLWSPEDPFLYDMTVTLRHKHHLVDKVNSYAAMRKISRAKDENGNWRMQLNNRTYFQMGTLDQGWWPDGLYTAPTDEALAYDIIKTKDLGFNMIRKHVKVESDRWYYHCDRLGMLVWQDMPSGDLGNEWEPEKMNGGTDRQRSDASKRDYYYEWQDIIDMLRSHPSVVVWVPFNEAWGQFDTEKTVEWTHRYDPTRLINPASGGNHRECGDMLDLHHYPNPDMYLKSNEVVNVLGEYGGIGWPVEEHLWWNQRNWGYIRFTSSDEVTAEYVKYAMQLKELVRQGFAASVYTQTTDVEGEVNGLMTYDRKMIKMNQQQVREANLQVRAAGSDAVNPLAVDPQRFNATVQGKQTALYTLRNNNGMEVQVTNFGARIVSIIMPDKNGLMRDVVLGFDNIQDYQNIPSDFGACIGRYANRIKNGELIIDDRTYQLPQNNFTHTLHGGPTGWQYRVYDAEQTDGRTLRLTLVSEDGDNGFPGQVKAGCVYTLDDDNNLKIEYFGTTNATTVLNMTNHTYFNLTGNGKQNILNHLLQIFAHQTTPIDNTYIPTGEIQDIPAGSAFDFFSAPKPIGQDIAQDHEQLRNGNGYDHNFILTPRQDIQPAATLYCPETGILLTVLTDQPGLQVYTGNFLDGTVTGKRGEVYGQRNAVCLETQVYPDTPHHPEWPTATLRPGDKYHTTTIFRFETK